MSTTQRPPFQCANSDCARTFGYPVNAAHTGIIIVTCPYCGQHSRADLDPFRRSTISVYRGKEGKSGAADGEFHFPSVIQTDVERTDDD